MLKKLFSYWLEIVTSTILVALVIFVLLNVIFRSVLKIGVPWIDEVDMFLFYYLVFLGTALGVKYNEHFTVDVIGLFPRAIQNTLIFIGNIAILLFIIAIIYYGWIDAIHSKDTISESLGISLFYSHVIAPISGVLMLYYYIKKWVTHYKSTRKVGEVE